MFIEGWTQEGSSRLEALPILKPAVRRLRPQGPAACPAATGTPATPTERPNQGSFGPSMVFAAALLKGPLQCECSQRSAHHAQLFPASTCFLSTYSCLFPELCTASGSRAGGPRPS